MARIVIIDELGESATELESTFSAAGHHALSVTDARHGIDFCHANSVNAVIVCVYLPGRDMETVLQLRKTLPHLPVIVFYARAAETDPSAFVLCVGDTSIIPKPVSLSTVLFAVEGIVP